MANSDTPERNWQVGGRRRRRRTSAERRADRAAGVDRFGRLLPRVAGTNPRALRDRGVEHVERDRDDETAAAIEAARIRSGR